MTLKEYNTVFSETVQQLAKEPSMADVDYFFALDGCGGFHSAEFFSESGAGRSFTLFPNGTVDDAAGLTAEMLGDLAAAAKTLKGAWTEFLRGENH